MAKKKKNQLTAAPQPSRRYSLQISLLRLENTNIATGKLHSG